MRHCELVRPRVAKRSDRFDVAIWQVGRSTHSACLLIIITAPILVFSKRVADIVKDVSEIFLLEFFPLPEWWQVNRREAVDMIERASEH